MHILLWIVVRAVVDVSVIHNISFFLTSFTSLSASSTFSVLVETREKSFRAFLKAFELMISPRISQTESRVDCTSVSLPGSSKFIWASKSGNSG